MDIDINPEIPEPTFISGKDLIRAGWVSGPDLGRALGQAKEILASNPGMSRAEVIAHLEANRPVAVPKIQLRDTPAPWTEAVRAETSMELDNIRASRTKMQELLRVPVIKRGAIMPDCCPAGSEIGTIPVGGAIEVHRAIIPSAHSADIACSMSATYFKSDRSISELMDHLQQSTRFGPGGRNIHKYIDHPVIHEDVWHNPFLQGLQDYAARHMADQGDGNHFAYIGKASFSSDSVRALETAGYDKEARVGHDEGEMLVLVTHHGSRGLGAQLYKNGQAAAIRATAKIAENIPDTGAWLSIDSPEGQNYWEALQYISRWTKSNHNAIHQLFLESIRTEPLLKMGNEHNFVWRSGEDSFMHGKGATPAWKDPLGRPLLGLVPLNMAREILITMGGNNDQFLSFSPHGAGRNQSRSSLMRSLKDSDGNLDPSKLKHLLARETAGLDVRWFQGLPDLSESPLGYKDASKVKAQIAEFGLATVTAEIKPLGCIMAGENPIDYREQRRLAKQRRHQAERRRVKQELRPGQLELEDPEE